MSFKRIIFFLACLFFSQQVLALGSIPLDPKTASQINTSKNKLPRKNQKTNLETNFTLFAELNKKAKALKTGCYEAEEGDSTPVSSPAAFFPKTPNDLQSSQIGKGGTVYFVDVNIENPGWTDVQINGDVCKSDKILHENYCTNKTNSKGSIKATGASTEIDCTLFGATCNAKLRACVFSKKAYIPPYCNDSDGDNIFNQGVVTSQSIYGGPVLTKIDSCGIDGKSVFEFTCNPDTETIITPSAATPCPSNFYCSNGACKTDNPPPPPNKSCKDLDPANDVTTNNKGATFNLGFGSITSKDGCQNDTTVNELTCDQENNLVPISITCQENEKCNDGLCVPLGCSTKPKSITNLFPLPKAAQLIPYDNLGSDDGIYVGNIYSFAYLNNDTTPDIVALFTSPYQRHELLSQDNLFQASTLFWDGPTGNHSILADFTGDTLTDFVFLDDYMKKNNEKTIQILKADGTDGIFSNLFPEVLINLNYPGQTLWGYQWFVTVDLDHDSQSLPDIIIPTLSNTDNTAHLKIYYNEGDAKFGVPIDILFPLSAEIKNEPLLRFLGTGFLNKDEYPDLVIIYADNNGANNIDSKYFVSYLISDKGSFDNVPVQTIEIPSAGLGFTNYDVSYTRWSLRDLNGDGLSDLVLSNPYFGMSILIWIQQQNGISFTVKPQRTLKVDEILKNPETGLDSSFDFNFGDINGDGIQDLVIDASEYGPIKEMGIWVLLATQPDGLFQNPTVEKIKLGDLGIQKGVTKNYLENSGIGLSDLNQDGCDDLVLQLYLDWNNSLDAYTAIIKSVP